MYPFDFNAILQRTGIKNKRSHSTNSTRTPNLNMDETGQHALPPRPSVGGGGGGQQNGPTDNQQQQFPVSIARAAELAQRSQERDCERSRKLERSLCRHEQFVYSCPWNIYALSCSSGGGGGGCSNPVAQECAGNSPKDASSSTSSGEPIAPPWAPCTRFAVGSYITGRGRGPVTNKIQVFVLAPVSECCFRMDDRTCLTLRCLHDYLTML